MSGPKTCSYSISAAERAQRQAEEQKRRAELAARLLAAKQKHSELEKRADRLTMAITSLQGQFPAETINIAVPSGKAPFTENPSVLEGFINKLDAGLSEAEATLQRIGSQANANESFRSATKHALALCSGEETTSSHAIQLFIEARDAKSSDLAIADRQSEIDRIIGRHLSENWRDASPDLEHLVFEAMGAESESRFSALLTEIRLQVQTLRKNEQLFEADAKKATELLYRLDFEIPCGEEPLKQRLELVRVGAIPFSVELDTLVTAALNKSEQTAKAELQASATEIIKATLADLGYDVAPIEETLFAKGGKVFFRKTGWNDYCVKLTVRPGESKMNFNVVRLESSQSDREVKSRDSDLAAENAWCSGYQQFVDTLAARGLDTNLTRHLPVGAVPVQTVTSEEVTLSSFGTPQKRRKKSPAVAADRKLTQ